MLKITLHDSEKLSWWYSQFVADKLDMKPPYQRRAQIWSPWKRGHLIDSIINGFDIPKFYVGNFYEMPVKKLNVAHKPYAIIDGKQRLGAIFEYFADGLPLNKSCICADFPGAQIGGLRYSELSRRFPLISQRIDDFVPTVMNVLTDEERKIMELFLRLNMGEAATGAEQRNAMEGPVPLMVREVSDHPFFTNRIRFNTVRMQEHNLVTKLLLFEFRDGFVDTKKSDLDNFAKQAAVWSLANPSPEGQPTPYTEARDRVFDVLEVLAGEFQTKDPLLSSAGSIPIYYWFAKKHPRLVNELRDFVLKLSEDIKEAVRQQRIDPARVDAQLISYYTMGRTTNDQASLDGRYRLFVKMFNDARKHPVLRR